MIPKKIQNITTQINYVYLIPSIVFFFIKLDIP